ncbi:hypothetical protein BJ684DRAFT_12498 [Piptocephalis cylindrospora]|uniref:COP9 signalosome complex subunit 4 n=1 Tax=Piptocephalis cylindrospora TaxID=1907219 RepID=A0A4P9XZE9_9FUNG|nr:hypothetical protein BJ684DRAFT_12498 [Piptocephalis cylindrospora]|eukprot:RKP11754.1 hypothetical protein BJ684DRAFT_12498 [Piptocephalis cylindrospora]
MTSADRVKEYIDYVFTQLPLVSSRYALDALIGQYTGMEPEVRTALTQAFETHAATLGYNYADQASNLYRVQASLHEEREEWGEAVACILRVPINSNRRTIGEEERLSHYTHLMRLYLEDENVSQARVYLNKASSLLTSEIPTSLALSFTLYKARILDLTGKYLDAAFRYRDLSYETSLDPEDRYQSLSRAVLCAILAPAGQQRVKILSTLYRDERASSLSYYEALTCVFQDQILRPVHTNLLVAALFPHHLAQGKDGRSPLDHAVLEHNLLALSRMYCTISFSSLGRWLGVEAVEAERLASRMIREGRVNARIHQVDGMMRIPSDGSLHPTPSTKEARLSQMCTETEAAVRRIGQLNPSWLASVSDEAPLGNDEVERGMAFI